MAKNIILIVLSITSLGLLLYGFDQRIEATNNMNLAIFNADSAVSASINNDICRDKNDSLKSVIKELQIKLEALDTN